MDESNNYCEVYRFVMTVGLGVVIYKLHQIQLEVEHLAHNAKHQYGGPVRTRKEEKEYIKRRRKEEGW